MLDDYYSRDLQRTQESLSRSPVVCNAKLVGCAGCTLHGLHLLWRLPLHRGMAYFLKYCVLSLSGYLWEDGLMRTVWDPKSSGAQLRARAKVVEDYLAGDRSHLS